MLVQRDSEDHQGQVVQFPWRAGASQFLGRRTELRYVVQELVPGELIRLRGENKQAEHSCMTLRGIRALGATTVTSAMLGSLRADARSRAEFSALAGVHRKEGT